MKYAIIFFMRRMIFLIISIAMTVYSLFYASLGGFAGNAGALSKIGLTHPLLFCTWGFCTFGVLAFGIILGFKKTKYKFYLILLIIALIGIILTVCFDFDYNKQTEYWLHCIGSLAFSASMGITVFLLLLLSKKYILTAICGVVLISDLVLLIIFKETAFIELYPIITGYILLNLNNYIKGRERLEIK